MKGQLCGERRESGSDNAPLRWGFGRLWVEIAVEIEVVSYVKIMTKLDCANCDVKRENVEVDSISFG